MNGREMRAAIQSMPIDVQQWLIRFGEVLKTNDIEKIFHFFVQLGIDPPDTRCGCDCLDDKVLRWVHENHRVYNLIIWGMLQAGQVIEPLRAVVEEDLAVEGDEGMEDFGRVIRKEYGRELLQHFLTGTPEWAAV